MIILTVLKTTLLLAWIVFLGLMSMAAFGKYDQEDDILALFLCLVTLIMMALSIHWF